MKRILHEPLLHFLLLGAAIFAGYDLLNRNGEPAPGRIVISQGQLASIVTGFTRTWQRPPTEQEMAGLIRDQVREEVFYREAMALGLDKDDTIIRRRLRQKMEFISDDIAAQSQPADADLNVYLQAHPDKFRMETQFTFRQVYLNPEKHGTNLANDAALLLAKLNQPGGDTGFAEMGDPFMLDNRFSAEPVGEITKLFGEKFTGKLGGLKLGQWEGPVESGYGVHLVCVSDRTEGRLPALTEVRDAVRREWADARRQEANEKFYQGLLKHYTVTIEQSPAATDKKLTAAK
jgi:PPIC-type PPIASE domain